MNKEIMAGNSTPSICIMGYSDYETFCGTVAVGNRLDSFGHSAVVIYQGVRLFKSFSKEKGIMFA